MASAAFPTPGGLPTSPPPVARPAAPSPPPPLEGTIEDTGAGRRPSVRCLAWRALGSHSVQGDAEAGSIEARGLLSVGGSVRVGLLLGRGTLDIAGSTTASGRIDGQGILRFGGAVEAAEMETRGTVRASGNVRVHGAFTAQGRIEIGGDLTATSVSIAGSIQAPASCRVERLEILLESPGRLGPVRAGSVRVSVGRAPPWKRAPLLVVDRIEAREVDLEGVHCGFLAADTIRLGKGCRITRAEGTIVERHRSAYVGFYSESAPPHGLSR